MILQILFHRYKCILLVVLLAPQLTYSIEANSGPVPETERDYTPALGIYESFGRWDKTVRIGYNPINAPANFSNRNDMLELLGEAASRWEKVSGIKIDILHPGDYQDDITTSVFALDQIVSVTWVNSAENFSARVAPRRGNYDPSLRYYPYLDGAITLNSRSSTWDNRTRAMRTLTHEIGHLLGLGHSDNPSSMMFANPYNTLQYPAEDDIRAVQALYGPPSAAIDPSHPQMEWRYQPLPKASDSFLATSKITAEDSALENNTIRESTREDGWLRLETPVNNRRGANPVASDVELVMIEPSGYVYSRRIRSLSCPAEKYCRPWTGLIKLDVLKQLPGNWQIHINDNASNQRLDTVNFTVHTSPQFNQPPSARVVVARTEWSNRIQVKVIADDSENDQISLTWAARETPEVLGADGVSAWKTLYLNHTGTNTFFIEINDDSPRYPGSSATRSAGGGFRTLLRLDVTAPLRGENTVKVTSSDLNAYHDSATELLTYYRLNSPVYEPSNTWPAPYNGITPPGSAGLLTNNISILDTNRQVLHACVRIVEDGLPGSLDGIEHFDINFSVLSMVTGTVQVKNVRPFNTVGALNEEYALPDCSGSYDLNKEVYTDIIMIDGQVFDTEYKLSNDAELIFKINKVSRL